jgi:hypothetical protein
MAIDKVIEYSFHRPVKFSICHIIRTNSDVYVNDFLFLSLEWAGDKLTPFVKLFTLYLRQNVATVKYEEGWLYIAMAVSARGTGKLWNTKSMELNTTCYTGNYRESICFND